MMVAVMMQRTRRLGDVVVLEPEDVGERGGYGYTGEARA